MSPSERIRILFIEDNSDDVELELAMLREAGLSVDHHVVETAPDVRLELDRRSWDVILCDYSMPELSGLDALRLAKELAPFTPFILVSGMVGEDVAVEAMRAGAQDYVLKDNLTRLASAVRRELRDAQARRDGALSQRGLRLLADAGAALAKSIDDREMLSGVPRFVIPGFGSLCVIDVVEDDGTWRRVASACADPAQEPLLRGIEARLPSRPPLPGALLSIDDVHSTAGDAPPIVELAKALGARAALCVPLTSQDRVIGAMSVAGPHAYSPVEVRIIEELASRLAVSVENARLYERAQRAVHIRDDFLAVASHELKTPLTALQLKLNGAQLALKKAEQSNEVVRAGERLTGAANQIERLTELVDRLLDVSRIAGGKLEMHLDEIDLAPLVSNVIDDLREQAQRVGSELRMKTSGSVIGRWDRSRLGQAFTNLLSNAIKYGAGKPIEVRLDHTDRGARLAVSDQGIGIAPEDVDRIFARFERAVPSNHYGGLGLGLYITRHIVQAHGGSIEVSSRAGEGSTFAIELPTRGSREG